MTAPVIFLLLWSAGFGIAKRGQQHAEPLAPRYACTLILLLPLALIFNPPLPRTPRAWAATYVANEIFSRKGWS